MKNFIIYRGPSLINGDPIIGVVTLKTSNDKIGDMAQLWIIRSDKSPVEAVRDKTDAAICGSCIHRHNKGGACYVQPFHAPLSIYNAFQAGRYSDLTDDPTPALMALHGRGIRLGAYGDPAALPADVLAFLCNAAAFFTGYTHQWKNKRLRHALDYCQASVDGAADIEKLKKIDPAAGYFLVTDKGAAPAGAIECLADSKGLSCDHCKACDGSNDVYINVHGTKARRFNADISVTEL